MSMISERFIDFFSSQYFKGKPDEFQDFLNCIEKPIPKTIRVKEAKVETVKKRLENDGWILKSTSLPRVFSIDRQENFDPLERRLGMSIDHLVGNFYIQEFAAAHPVDLLADGKVHNDSFLILDMASSPGGKSSQLAEYFPESFIIANEPNRNRIPQLLQNLERMHMPNAAITLYSGQQWKHLPETFERILLDAPCSGEGTAYKGTNALKFWHIKSIKKIAKLQTKLLESALVALKTGGEMVYSTCSLNHLENEGVLEAMQEKYGDAIEIIFEKKFWPHIDKTGGFFMAKIVKRASFETIEIRGLTTNSDISLYNGSLKNWNIGEKRKLYQYKNQLLCVKNSHIIAPILNQIYCMRLGENIGTLDKHTYTPNARAYRDLSAGSIQKYTLKNERELDDYLRGEYLKTDTENGFVLLQYDNETIALETVRKGVISNTFPSEWRRK